LTRLGFGINVATCSHSTSGTVHDLIALICHSIPVPSHQSIIIYG
jgi:hypothetical protein